MAEIQEFDIVIVGGGPGGYVAALRAAQLGAKVALVEKDRLGGTCLNRGCIPTKALAKAAEVLLEAQHMEKFGLSVQGAKAEMPKVIERKNQVVNTLVSGIEALMKGGGIEVLKGTGRIVSPRAVSVDGREVRGRKLILAPGSVPARIPIPGLDLPGVVTSDGILDIQTLPKSLAIIGGGVIGIEFASIFAALGSKVYVVEMLPMILPPVDEEIARRFMQVARSQGIEVNTAAKVKEIVAGKSGLTVNFDTAKGPQSLDAEMVLVAVGRSPYTEGLGAAEAGVTMNRRAIAVNDKMETNLPGVYAIGDASGGIMLAHVASYQGEIAVENALGKAERRADYRLVPNCIFSIPEIADVGLTEKQAQEQGLPLKVSKFPFSALGRAHTMGETVGLVKLLCHGETGQVLGAHIMGPHATDIISEVALAMKLGATAKDLAHTIHAHPTLPEAIYEAALGQLDGSLHYRQARL